MTTMISYDRTAMCLTPLAPRKAFTNAAASMVQELNNRACMLVAIGEFAEANHLLSLALEKHKSKIEDFEYMDDSESYEPEFEEPEFDEHYIPLSSPLTDDHNEYGNDDMDSSNDTYDYHYDCPRDQEQEATNTLPSATPALCRRSSVMTTCSLVRNTSYAGQQDYESSIRLCHKYHQVYSQPIIMDDIEWESSSPEDQSFVLVFNSALSNHLWGMKLLSLTGTDYHKDPFETAKALYLLALETLWNNGNTSALDGAQIRSVDKLCVPAIMNNLSHASKVLDGCATQESSSYDAVLLKSIFWWIDGNSSVYGSSVFSSSDLRRASDGDAEVIEAFMDTVFYLIGLPESTVPAAAA